MLPYEEVMKVILVPDGLLIGWVQCGAVILELAREQVCLWTDVYIALDGGLPILQQLLREDVRAKWAASREAVTAHLGPRQTAQVHGFLPCSSDCQRNAGGSTGGGI